MAERSGYPYFARLVPTVGHVPPGQRSIGVPDLLLCRQDTASDVMAAVVDVLATEAPRLAPLTSGDRRSVNLWIVQGNAAGSPPTATNAIRCSPTDSVGVE